MISNNIKILGIDPGTCSCGFACVQTKTPNPYVLSDFIILDAGVIKINSKIPTHQRVGMLNEQVKLLIQQTLPNIIVIEKAFGGINISSAIKLGEARGAIISAAYQHNVPITQLTPSEVKKIITGNGSASKNDLQKALKLFTNYDCKNLSYDTSDALALALCYGLSMSFTKKLSLNPQASALNL